MIATSMHRHPDIIADQRRKLEDLAVDDFVTSLRKEATVQSGRGNLYRGKIGRPIPNYSRSSSSLGAVVFVSV